MNICNKQGLVGVAEDKHRSVGHAFVHVLGGPSVPCWLTCSGQPCAFQSIGSLKCYGIFLCFNKCVFANVSLGENIFLLFLCVTSLGLSGEVKPTALALAPFLACPLLFFSLSLFGEEINLCF